MNFNEAHIALFDRYLNQEMSAAEIAAFDDRLANEPTFAKEFEAFKTFEQEIKNAEITAFKDQLKEWDGSTGSPQVGSTGSPQVGSTVEPAQSEKSASAAGSESSQQEKIAKKGRVFPLKAIGLLAAVLVIGFMVVYSFFGDTNQAIANSYFTPYDNIVTIRGEKVDLDEGLLYYEKKEYQKAIAVFEKITDNAFADFYKAESHFALKDYENAIQNYEEVLKTGTIFYEVAEFHLGLAYLAIDKTGKAIQIFERMDDKSAYIFEARELLSDLK